MTTLGPDEQRTIIAKLLEALPDACGIVLLGNTAGIRHGVPNVTTTKDVDVAVILLDEDQRVAPRERIDDVLDDLGIEPTRYPADRSFVQAAIPIDGVHRTIDFIRGKKRDRPDGTFLHRDLLNTVTRAAQADDGVHLPSLTDLIVMKAWAATDQARKADQAQQTGADATANQRRSQAYEQDTRRYAEHALDKEVLDLHRVNGLLAGMRDERASDVRAVLTRAGVLEP